MENKKVIGVVQVLQHLKDGMTREDIAEHYGISKAECKLLFQHPSLKGKKTIKKPSFVVVEDATADIEVNEEEEVTTDSAPDTEVESDSKEEENDTDVASETKESFGSNTSDDVEVEEENANGTPEEVKEPAKATWD